MHDLTPKITSETSTTEASVDQGATSGILLSAPTGEMKTPSMSSAVDAATIKAAPSDVGQQDNIRPEVQTVAKIEHSGVVELAPASEVRWVDKIVALSINLLYKQTCVK